MSSSSDNDYDDPMARKDKIILMRAHAKRFDEVARRKEVEMRYKNTSSVEDFLGVNDLLIDAIESKLSVLKGINA
jgi:hypothetical protein